VQVPGALNLGCRRRVPFLVAHSRKVFVRNHHGHLHNSLEGECCCRNGLLYIFDLSSITSDKLGGTSHILEFLDKRIILVAGTGAARHVNDLSSAVVDHPGRYSTPDPAQTTDHEVGGRLVEGDRQGPLEGLERFNLFPSLLHGDTNATNMLSFLHEAERVLCFRRREDLHWERRDMAFVVEVEDGKDQSPGDVDPLP
jgi:hypothetical protein